MLIVQEAGGVAAEVLGRELVVLDHAARRTPAVASTPRLLDALLAERRRR
jgi:fructose-1,6-bisphosphatase/inositol monophosphatase family enzyme